MNVVDAVVTKVLSEPVTVSHDGLTWVEQEVEYDCWGKINTTTLMFKVGEVPDVKPGYEFLT